MTLNASEPTDVRMVSELPAYIREGRVAINAVSGSGNVGNTDLSIAAGVTSLTVGTDIGAYGYEIVKVTGTGVAVLATILGGSEGQMKVFIFQDANITMSNSALLANGTFSFNHLPVGLAFAPAQYDAIALVNIGGDGAATYGYWMEVFRTISVR
jgi:hypothetical protein